jgi:hypothetical protein
LFTGFLFSSLTYSYVIGAGKTCRFGGKGTRTVNWMEANLMEQDLMATNELTTVEAMPTDQKHTDQKDTSEKETEMSLGDVYDGIADRLAEARTRALMGERQEALGLMQAASLEYTRFREVLKDYPGHHALEYAFTVTIGQLCSEQEQAEAANALPQPKAKSRPRRKVERAA